MPVTGHDVPTQLAAMSDAGRRETTTEAVPDARSARSIRPPSGGPTRTAGGSGPTPGSCKEAARPASRYPFARSRVE